MLTDLSKNSKIEENKEEVENIYKEFKNQFELILKKFKDGKYLQENDTNFMFYLGALLNDTIFRQQKYFRTSGLLKQIVPFYKYISIEKAEMILNICLRLQRSISRTKMIKTSPLKKVAETLFNNISEKEFISSDEDLALCLITGYNLYSKAIFDVFSKEKSYELQYIKLWEFSNYKDNNSFKIGFLIAIYFFKIEEMQRKFLKTMSLLKKINRFLRKPKMKEAKKFLKEINSIALKVHSTMKYTSNKKSKIRNYLPGDFIQLRLFEYLNMELDSDINSLELFLGFITGFIWRYNFRLHKIKLDIDPIKQVNEPERILKNDQIVVTEEHFIKSLIEKNFQNQNAETSYLLGILFQAISQDEEKILKTRSLLKQFSFLFRTFELKNIKKTYLEIFRVYIKLWMNKVKTTYNPKEQTVKYFRKFPYIGAQLVFNFGKIIDFVNENNITLAFIQGYDSFRRLYNKLNA